MKNETINKVKKDLLEKIGNEYDKYFNTLKDNDEIKKHYSGIYNTSNIFIILITIFGTFLGLYLVFSGFGLLLSMIIVMSSTMVVHFFELRRQNSKFIKKWENNKEKMLLIEKYYINDFFQKPISKNIQIYIRENEPNLIPYMLTKLNLKHFNNICYINLLNFLVKDFYLYYKEKE